MSDRLSISELQKKGELTQEELTLLSSMDISNLNTDVTKLLQNLDILNTIDTELSKYMNRPGDEEKKQLIYERYMDLMTQTGLLGVMEDEIELEGDYKKYQDILIYNLSKGKKTYAEMQVIISMIKGEIDVNPYLLFEGYKDNKISRVMSAYCSLPGVTFEEAFEQFQIMNSMLSTKKNHLSVFRLLCENTGITKEESKQLFDILLTIEKIGKDKVEAIDSIIGLDEIDTGFMLENLEIILAMLDYQVKVITAFAKLEGVDANDILNIQYKAALMKKENALVFEGYCLSKKLSKYQVLEDIDKIIKWNINPDAFLYQYPMMGFYQNMKNNEGDVLSDFKTILDVEDEKVFTLSFIFEIIATHFECNDSQILMRVRDRLSTKTPEELDSIKDTLINMESDVGQFFVNNLM